jgi:hypothetical protein
MLKTLPHPGPLPLGEGESFASGFEDLWLGLPDSVATWSEPKAGMSQQGVWWELCPTLTISRGVLARRLQHMVICF